MLEVIGWAQRHVADDELYAVALVVENTTDAPGRGLVWLVGMDANSNVEGDPEGLRCLARMMARRGRAVVLDE